MSKNAANVSQSACAKSYHLRKFSSRGTGHSGLGQGPYNDPRGGSFFAGTLVSAGCWMAYHVMGPSLDLTKRQVHAAHVIWFWARPRNGEMWRHFCRLVHFSCLSAINSCFSICNTLYSNWKIFMFNFLQNLSTVSITVFWQSVDSYSDPPHCSA